MTQKNIIADMSTYTRIPLKALNAVLQKEMLCIGSAISDAKIAKEDAIVLNIGIGTLSINLTDMLCKFMPSKELKTIIKHSLETNDDPVELEIEQEIIKKLMALCEDNL